MENTSLGFLAGHLVTRRKEILRAWREAIRLDAMLTAGDALPRKQLNDHVPSALAAFERKLNALASGSDPDVEAASIIDAAGAHGLHRWQQGYDLRQVTRELGHLNRLLVAELDHFASAATHVDPSAFAEARQAWADAYSSSVEESANQFFEMQQIEATSHINELEQAAKDVLEIEVRRNDLWEQIAHDLRGNVGVVASASQILKRSSAKSGSLEQSNNFAAVLEKNVQSLRVLLDDITGLTRLQAGRETRRLETVEIGDHLTQLCSGLTAFADQRGLTLTYGSAFSLQVTTDTTKVRRIAQNLILNALKYTESGGVAVSWYRMEAPEDMRWVLRVQDSGPGMDPRTSSPLANALIAATEVAHTASVGGPQAEIKAEVPKITKAHSPRMSAGEGLGLSIVKRLADLLDATIELESDVGQGSTFRIYLPLSYARPECSD